MLTKADFEVLARHIRDMPDHALALRTTRESAARTVADACEQINPRFNRSRFLAAAGVDGGLTHETE